MGLFIIAVGLFITAVGCILQLWSCLFAAVELFVAAVELFVTAVELFICSCGAICYSCGCWYMYLVCIGELVVFLFFFSRVFSEIKGRFEPDCGGTAMWSRHAQWGSAGVIFSHPEGGWGCVPLFIFAVGVFPHCC